MKIKKFNLFVLILLCSVNISLVAGQMNVQKTLSSLVSESNLIVRGYVSSIVSNAISVGGIRHIVLIGHNNCGMVNLADRKEQFIDGLTLGAGWEKEKAEEHFNQFAPMFEIGNEIDFVVSESNRLRLKYLKITIAPMLYKVDDNRLYLIKED